MKKSLQKYNHENELVKWTERISACRSSNLTVQAWCEENSIPLSTYYRWQKELYHHAAALQEAQQFVEITPPNTEYKSGAAITVWLEGIEVEINNGADPTLIETVIQQLKPC